MWRMMSMNLISMKGAFVRLREFHGSLPLRQLDHNVCFFLSWGDLLNNASAKPSRCMLRNDLTNFLGMIRSSFEKLSRNSKSCRLGFPANYHCSSMYSFPILFSQRRCDSLYISAEMCAPRSPSALPSLYGGHRVDIIPTLV